MEVHRPAASPQWIDIDSADMENPMACTEYVESIMDHLYQAEVCPDPFQPSYTFTRAALLSPAGGGYACALSSVKISP